MIKLGVTGGIGSGKSIVCKLLSLHNIPIYDADSEAKKLNNSSPIIKNKLIERFGNSLYINNKLDRQKLANLIFNNKDNLQYVNSVIHTELAKHFLDWVQAHNTFDIIAIDAAVLFEAGFQKYVDKVITVTAPINKRIERVSKRDNMTSEQIQSRIKSQMSDEERIKLSNYVIINDDNISIIKQAQHIIQDIINPIRD